VSKYHTTCHDRKLPSHQASRFLRPYTPGGWRATTRQSSWNSRQNCGSSAPSPAIRRSDSDEHVASGTGTRCWPLEHAVSRMIGQRSAAFAATSGLAPTPCATRAAASARSADSRHAANCSAVSIRIRSSAFRVFKQRFGLSLGLQTRLQHV
jgi:hypothetical protein